MTHDEMIAVIAAHKDGKRIEAKAKCGGIWGMAATPCWDFDDYDYRIAELKWRDATIDDLKRAPLPCRVRDHILNDWISDLLVGYVASMNGCNWMVRGGERFLFCQVLDDK